MAERSAEALCEEAEKLAREGTDNAEVARLLQTACTMGSAEAAYAIANWYHYGIHYHRDPSKELEFVRLAASRGHPAAYFTLGSKYEGGEKGLVRKNERLALRHYIEAALLGDADAFMEVGRCYHYGIGAPIDKALARIWKREGRKRGGRWIGPRVD